MAEGNIIDSLRAAFGRREASAEVATEEVPAEKAPMEQAIDRIENILSQETVEPVRNKFCVTKSDPIADNVERGIPRPKGDGWRLEDASMIDPPGGPLTVFFVWVHD
jgi:hypothetical protein